MHLFLAKNISVRHNVTLCQVVSLCTISLLYLLLNAPFGIALVNL